MPRNLNRWVCLAVLAVGLHQVAYRTSRAAEPAVGRKADQEALKAFAPLVGTWKGVGQPQRGSARGSWTETGAWAWQLTPDSAALVLKLDHGKFFKAFELRPGTEPGALVLHATLVDGSQRTYAGSSGSGGKSTLEAREAGSEGVRRITLTPLHETRFLMLLEGGEPDRRARLAEVGFTRQGVAFATGPAGPVCIVTGGRGTIAVTHQGKTYYVCCSGCKDLFQENPEAILAEAKQKAASLNE